MHLWPSNYKQCLVHWMIDTGPIPADYFTVQVITVGLNNPPSSLRAEVPFDKAE